MAKKKKKNERKIWYSNLRCPKCNIRLWIDGKKLYCEKCGYKKGLDILKI